MKVLNLPKTGPKSPLRQGKNIFSKYAKVQKGRLKDRALLLLIRDLVRLGWTANPKSKDSLQLIPPNRYDKSIVKEAMAYARNDIIEKDASWIKANIGLARANLARGEDVLKSSIKPRIEVCETQKQHNLFRLFRYYWSSPFSDYVGRRIKLLIRDDGIKGSPIIGIAALGSSIIHIPERDKWIGWDMKTRSDRIIYMMDAYVLGALPPYNYLLGGKLISYILASNEVRDIYKKKYLNAKTIIKSRKASELALIVTTSLYGENSSQYNRLKYGKSLLYQPIGTTSGFGSLHISAETFSAMRELAERAGGNTSHEFGMGPNWRIRMIRSACNVLNLDADIILKHSFQRGLFALPLAKNWRSFLSGETKKIQYRNIPLKSVVRHWKKRWLTMRRKNPDIIRLVKEFEPENFDIKPTELLFEE